MHIYVASLSQQHVFKIHLCGIYLQNVLFHCSGVFHWYETSIQYLFILLPAYGCLGWFTGFTYLLYFFVILNVTVTNVLLLGWTVWNRHFYRLLFISYDSTRFLSVGAYLQDYIWGIYLGVAEMLIHKVRVSSTLKMMPNCVIKRLYQFLLTISKLSHLLSTLDKDDFGGCEIWF